jgi:hypothetical protein
MVCGLAFSVLGPRRLVMYSGVQTFVLHIHFVYVSTRNSRRYDCVTEKL